MRTSSYCLEIKINSSLKKIEAMEILSFWTGNGAQRRSASSTPSSTATGVLAGSVSPASSSATGIGGAIGFPADYADLPEEAAAIYTESGGFPIVINMIGSLLKDHPNR